MFGYSTVQLVTAGANERVDQIFAQQIREDTTKLGEGFAESGVRQEFAVFTQKCSQHEPACQILDGSGVAEIGHRRQSDVRSDCIRCLRFEGQQLKHGHRGHRVTDECDLIVVGHRLNVGQFGGKILQSLVVERELPERWLARRDARVISRVRVASEIAQPNIVASFGECEREIAIVVIVQVAAN